MKFSQLLLDKLNSQAELTKRIQLAKNVFISTDLKIGYKEELIITWFLEKILESKDEEKEYLINGFCFCISSNVISLLPGSGIRADAKSKMTKSLISVMKNLGNSDTKFAESVFILLRKFDLHYKSYPKQYVKIMNALLNLQISNTLYKGILNLSLNMFKSGIPHEKFVIHLLRKDFHYLFKNLDSNNEKGRVLLEFIQKMLFKKELVTQFRMVLHATCTNQAISVENSIICALVCALHNVFASDLDEIIKTEVFAKVFQSLVESLGSDDNQCILQAFIFMCHLLGLEQAVLIKQSDEVSISIINETFFQEAFNVSPIEANTVSYFIIRSLIEILSNYSLDFGVTICNTTYNEWFEALIIATIKKQIISSIHLNFFRACADLKASFIEKNIGKIVIKVLTHSIEKFDDDDFKNSFMHFMEMMLELHSKLQRTQKFIIKFLKSIGASKSSLTLKNILSINFINEFSNMITLMPSMQSLSFMDDLVMTLEKQCVKVLEENTESVNILLIQVSCALLAAYLSGVRILSHLTPPSIVKLFIEKMITLKGILGRFGKGLLVRIHDRELVQPFLNLCYYWGELELLIIYYIEEHAEQLIHKDTSPTDLCTLHSYLSGEEWNILAERVSNFGARQCCQLFLKLILQKLRTLELKKCHSLINGEATSKHILILLKSELYKHNIVEELSPEDFTFLFSNLPQAQSRLLLEKLYSQASEHDEVGRFLNWIRNSVLLENRNFVILSLVTILVKIASKLNECNKHNGVMNDPVNALSLEFIDEDYHVNKGEFSKLVEKLNELLNNHTVMTKNFKVTQMKMLIDVLKYLPLVHMPPEISSLALSALTFLAVIFSSVKELLEPLLLIIKNLILTFRKTSTFTCFNVGLCIKWLLEINCSENIQCIQNDMIKLLLKIGVGTENGLQELNKLVRCIKKKNVEQDPKSLEHQILLYQDLGKSWVKSRKRSLDNEVLAKFRQKLSKRIRKELQRQHELTTATVDQKVLVTAYGLELTRAVKLKKKEIIINLINMNFDKFFDLAISKVKSDTNEDAYVDFLTTILIHMSEIRTLLKKNTLKKIWNALKNRSQVDWKLFYKIADEEEFEFFLLDLLKIWKMLAIGKKKKINFETYFGIWQEFYGTDKYKFKQLYGKNLKRLFVQFSSGIVVMDSLSPDEMVQLFNFIRFCGSRADIAMTSTMLDSCFDIIYNCDYQDNWTSKQFQKVFESCVGAASWFLSTRAVRIRDKIHNIFQLFDKLTNVLVRRSSVTLDLHEDDLFALSSCAHCLEKWTSKMINRSKDFSRVSVYFIAILVSSFVRTTIYPPVKSPLVKCINNFLSISDAHNVEYLLRVLNPGSQQIFQGIYETFKKYYKFKGKI